ncbi:Phosphatidic acid phosphatase [Balamuthia mandrillaris]
MSATSTKRRGNKAAEPPFEAHPSSATPTSPPPRAPPRLSSSLLSVLAILSLGWLFLAISYNLVWLEERGLPLLLSLQSLRSPLLDRGVYLCSTLGFEAVLVLVPLFCFLRPDPSLLSISSSSPSSSPAAPASASRLFLFGSVGCELWLLILCGWYVNSLLKSMFLRSRPFAMNPDLDAEPIGEHSFPSGHSTVVVLFWLYIHHHLHHFFANRLKMSSAVVGTAAVLLASFSRVYFAVHFPHDVIAGWITGYLVFLVYSILRPSPSCPEQEQHKQPLLTLFSSLFLLTTLFIFLFDASVLLQQSALSYVPGSILAFLFCLLLPTSFHHPPQRHPQQYNEEKEASKPRTKKRQIITSVLAVTLGVFVVLWLNLGLAKFWERTFGGMRGFVPGFLTSCWMIIAHPLFACFASLKPQ